MGRIFEKVSEIYKSKKPLNDKILSLIYYGRKVGINSYNFDIFIDEIKKYEWEERQ